MSKKDLSDIELVLERPQKTLEEVSIELAETQKALENARKCVELWHEDCTQWVQEPTTLTPATIQLGNVGRSYTTAD